MATSDLPLGRRAYFKIPHLPGSRTGRSDKHAPAPLSRRCLVEALPGDTVLVQEKLDGSCVAVARLGGELLALGREGKLASRSRNPGRQLFARWVDSHREALRPLLEDGEWMVGEWLALAHGTRYALNHEPFVPFDLFDAAGAALTLDGLEARLGQNRLLRTPQLIHRGGAIGTAEVLRRLDAGGGHGADSVEGAVWRLERAGQVVARAKYVRLDKVDGHLLPENSGQDAVWNWTERPALNPGARPIMKHISFVTSNGWKHEEAKKLLAGLEVVQVRLALDKPEAARSLAEIATARVRDAYARLRSPVFVENTGLFLREHDEGPGAGFKKLFLSLGEAEFARRYGGSTGVTRVAVAFTENGDDVELFEGQNEGQLAREPRGDGGYGWDRLWVPNGYVHTLAELASSKVLVNMRHLPFLELGQRLRGTPGEGVYEAHVTVAPCDPTAFAQACEALEVKCIAIELPRGAEPIQPMTGSHHRGSLLEVQREVHALAAALVRRGFQVTRTKLEAVGAHPELPLTDEAAAAVSPSRYFEHHLKIALLDGASSEERSEQSLVEPLRRLGAHLSRNGKRPQERFITMRSPSVGMAAAEARFARVESFVRAQGLSIRSRVREYTLFDSAPEVDRGWLE